MKFLKARPELSRDLVGARLMEQVNCRYYRLGHTLSGGRSHCQIVALRMTGELQTSALLFRVLWITSKLDIFLYKQSMGAERERGRACQTTNRSKLLHLR